jgi:hypothetical protein
MHFGRNRNRKANNIKVELGYKYVCWIQLSHGRVSLWTTVIMVMKILGFMKPGKFLGPAEKLVAS